jgi:hypothetical protein
MDPLPTYYCMVVVNTYCRVRPLFSEIRFGTSWDQMIPSPGPISNGQVNHRMRILSCIKDILLQNMVQCLEIMMVEC